MYDTICLFIKVFLNLSPVHKRRLLGLLAKMEV